MAGQTEGSWVEGIRPRVQDDLKSLSGDGKTVQVLTKFRLIYASEVIRHGEKNAPETRETGYQTDLLIRDNRADESWVPRVVIECKLDSVTTHDALTYSAKAATHKQVHPYLRYGILVAGEPSLPARLVRHGTHFDFMMVWARSEPSKTEWDALVATLKQEVEASRRLQVMITERSSGRPTYRLLHRPIRLE